VIGAYLAGHELPAPTHAKLNDPTTRKVIPQ
jgi:hypothetical protein